MPPNLPRYLAGVSVVITALIPQPVQAQIAGDGSLGTQVNGELTVPCTGFCVITDGTNRGSNLFHSFRQFSLPNRDTAAFITPSAIQNVVVRVTGRGDRFISNINGTIATIDPGFTEFVPTNFFLLNPNGIIFGPNASLLNGGSFLATTAERMLFQDGTFFSADDPTPLLTISVPIGLQFGSSPRAIRIQDAFLSAGVRDDFTDLTLVGGDILVDQSIVLTLGQGIELAGVAAAGRIAFTQTGNRLQLSDLGNSARANISLTNQSQMGSLTSGGRVSLYGQNLTLADGSAIITNTDSEPGAGSSPAGNIMVNATGTVRLSNGSQLNSTALDRGDGGQITVLGQRVELANGSVIGSVSMGVGNAGDVTVQATESITFSGRNMAGTTSGILSAVGSLSGVIGTGNGGRILLQAPIISLDDSSIGSSNLFAQGNAGTIRVEASKQLSMTNGAVIKADTIGTGDAGNIELAVSRLELTSGSLISASTFGRGNAGKVQITADTITLSGNAPNNKSRSGIFNQVDPTGIGTGGDITVQTNSLTIANGAQISASTFGQGDAGNVQVSANAITLDGTTPDDRGNSGIFSQVNLSGTGTGGDIRVGTNSLTITNGAQISASTFGQGNAGQVQIVADVLTLDGTTRNGQTSSAIGSQVESTGVGRGGDVTIQTRASTITNGAQISATTLGQGNAGNVSITAHDRLTIDGVSANGQVSTGIFIASFSASQAGNVVITTPQLYLDHQGVISAISTAVDGGNITLNIRELLLMRRGSLISATAGVAEGGGNGGNITINAPKGFIIGLKAENSDITANAFTGNGGKVTITAQGIYGLEFRSRLTPFSDITASSQFGNSGIVTLNTPDIDPSRGLQPLPVGLVDPSQQIDRSCAPRGQADGGSFTITGRGGLPESPFEPLRSREAITNWVEVSSTQAVDQPNPSRNQVLIVPPSEAIVEADRWLVDKDGQVILVASHSTAEQGRFWSASPCPAAMR
ncbi:filamentous hemagglutinin N-terminal domain-containing protein [Pantanalinema rosaneae CENA516]|uniref:two-partner secretion domain-containing protein n=1 Tax=Pantanalinema rosaneae TaxID=1620701 RepID=UPI003D6FE80B